MWGRRLFALSLLVAAARAGWSAPPTRGRTAPGPFAPACSREPAPTAARAARCAPALSSATSDFAEDSWKESMYGAREEQSRPPAAARNPRANPIEPALRWFTALFEPALRGLGSLFEPALRWFEGFGRSYVLLPLRSGLRARPSGPASAWPASPAPRPRSRSPTAQQRASRQELIEKLVWLDAEGMVGRIARSVDRAWASGMPWASPSELTEQLRWLQHRSPIMAWHLKHTLIQQTVAPTVVPANPRLAAQLEAERNAELRVALRSLYPAFVTLVRDATRHAPSATPRLSRRLAHASVLLSAWNGARWLNLAPKRRFALMNSFLDVLVRTVAECRAALDATA